MSQNCARQLVPARRSSLLFIVFLWIVLASSIISLAASQAPTNVPALFDPPDGSFQFGIRSFPLINSIEMDLMRSIPMNASFTVQMSIQSPFRQSSPLPLGLVTSLFDGGMDDPPESTFECSTFELLNGQLNGTAVVEGIGHSCRHPLVYCTNGTSRRISVRPSQQGGPLFSSSFAAFQIQWKHVPFLTFCQPQVFIASTIPFASTLFTRSYFAFVAVDNITSQSGQWTAGGTARLLRSSPLPVAMDNSSTLYFSEFGVDGSSIGNETAALELSPATAAAATCSLANAETFTVSRVAPGALVRPYAQQCVAVRETFYITSVFDLSQACLFDDSCRGFTTRVSVATGLEEPLCLLFDATLSVLESNDVPVTYVRLLHVKTFVVENLICSVVVGADAATLTIYGSLPYSGLITQVVDISIDGVLSTQYNPPSGTFTQYDPTNGLQSPSCIKGVKVASLANLAKGSTVSVSYKMFYGALSSCSRTAKFFFHAAFMSGAVVAAPGTLSPFPVRALSSVEGSSNVYRTFQKSSDVLSSVTLTHGVTSVSLGLDRPAECSGESFSLGAGNLSQSCATTCTQTTIYGASACSPPLLATSSESLSALAISFPMAYYPYLGVFIFANVSSPLGWNGFIANLKHHSMFRVFLVFNGDASLSTADALLLLTSQARNLPSSMLQPLRLHSTFDPFRSSQLRTIFTANWTTDSSENTLSWVEALPNPSMQFQCVIDFFDSDTYSFCSFPVPRNATRVRLYSQGSCPAASRTYVSRLSGELRDLDADMTQLNATVLSCSELVLCRNFTLYDSDLQRQTSPLSYFIFFYNAWGWTPPCDYFANVVVEFDMFNASTMPPAESVCGTNSTPLKIMESVANGATSILEPDVVRCNDASTCIPLSEICDGITQCGDNSDEASCNSWFLVEVNSKLRLIPSLLKLAVSTPTTFERCKQNAMAFESRVFQFDHVLGECYIVTVHSQWENFLLDPFTYLTSASAGTNLYARLDGGILSYSHCTDLTTCSGNGIAVPYTQEPYIHYHYTQFWDWTPSYVTLNCTCYCTNGYSGTTCKQPPQMSSLLDVMRITTSDFNYSMPDPFATGSTYGTLDVYLGRGIAASNQMCQCVSWVHATFGANLSAVCSCELFSSDTTAVVKLPNTTIVQADVGNVFGINFTSIGIGSYPALQPLTDKHGVCDLKRPCTCKFPAQMQVSAVLVSFMVRSGSDLKLSLGVSGGVQWTNYSCGSDMVTAGPHHLSCWFDFNKTAVSPLFDVMVIDAVGSNLTKGYYQPEIILRPLNPVLPSIDRVPTIELGLRTNSLLLGFSIATFAVALFTFAIGSVWCRSHANAIRDAVTAREVQLFGDANSENNNGHHRLIKLLLKLLTSAFLEDPQKRDDHPDESEELIIGRTGLTKHDGGLGMLIASALLLLLAVFLALAYSTSMRESRNASVVIERYRDAMCAASLLNPTPLGITVADETYISRICSPRAVVGVMGTFTINYAAWCDVDAQGTVVVRIQTGSSRTACEAAPVVTVSQDQCISVGDQFGGDDQYGSYVRMRCGTPSSVARLLATAQGTFNAARLIERIDTFEAAVNAVPEALSVKKMSGDGNNGYVQLLAVTGGSQRSFTTSIAQVGLRVESISGATFNNKSLAAANMLVALATNEFVHSELPIVQFYDEVFQSVNRTDSNNATTANLTRSFSPLLMGALMSNASASYLLATNAIDVVPRSFFEAGDLPIGVLHSPAAATTTNGRQFPSRYYDIEQTYIDIGRYFTGSAYNGASAFSISMYLKVTNTTQGFAFAVTDAIEDVATHVSPLLETLKTIIAVGGDGSMWFNETFHVYSSLYVDGPQSKLVFAHASPETTAAGAAGQWVDLLTWDLDTLQSSFLFNGLWHHVAIQLSRKNGKSVAQLFIDGTSSQSVLGWSQCLTAEIQPVADIFSSNLRLPRSQRLKRGGSLWVGDLDGGVGQVEFKPTSINIYHMWQQGTDAMRRKNRIDTYPYTILGAVLIGIAGVVLTGTIALSWWRSNSEAATPEDIKKRIAMLRFAKLFLQRLPRDESDGQEYDKIDYETATRWLEVSDDQFAHLLVQLHDNTSAPANVLVRILYAYRRKRLFGSAAGEVAGAEGEVPGAVGEVPGAEVSHAAAARRSSMHLGDDGLPMPTRSQWRTLIAADSNNGVSNLDDVVQIMEEESGAADEILLDSSFAPSSSFGDSGLWVSQSMVVDNNNGGGIGEALSAAAALALAPQALNALLALPIGALLDDEVIEELERQAAKQKKGVSLRITKLKKQDIAQSHDHINATPLTDELSQLLLPVVLVIQSVYVWMSSWPIAVLYMTVFEKVFGFFSLDWTMVFLTGPLVTLLLQLFAALALLACMMYFVVHDQIVFGWYVGKYTLRRDLMQIAKASMCSGRPLATDKTATSSRPQPRSVTFSEGNETTGNDVGEELAANPTDPQEVQSNESPPLATSRHLSLISDVVKALVATFMNPFLPSEVMRQVEPKKAERRPVPILSPAAAHCVAFFVGATPVIPFDVNVKDEEEDATASVNPLVANAEEMVEVIPAPASQGPPIAASNALPTLVDGATCETPWLEDGMLKGFTFKLRCDVEIKDTITALPLEQRTSRLSLLRKKPSSDCGTDDDHSVGIEAGRLRSIGPWCVFHRDQRLVSVLQSDVFPFADATQCCIAARGKLCKDNKGGKYCCIARNADGSKCSYAVCQKHFRGSLVDNIIADVMRILRYPITRGWGWVAATFITFAAQAAYTPVVKTALMILACHPFYRCQFPYCWGSSSSGYSMDDQQRFIIGVYLCIAVIVGLGLGLPLMQFVLLRRRRTILQSIFFAPEYQGLYSTEPTSSAELVGGEDESSLLKYFVTDDEWGRFLYSDSSVLAAAYRTLKFEWFYLSPMLLAWKIALLAPAVLIPVGTFEQGLGIAVAEACFALFIFVIQPFSSPLVNVMYGIGSAHQLCVIGLQNLDIVAQYQGREQGLGVAIVSITSIYLFVVFCLISYAFVGAPFGRTLDRQRRKKMLERFGLYFSPALLYMAPHDNANI